MANFTYQARNSLGELISGTIKASYLEEVRDELRRKNLYLISAKPETNIFRTFQRGSLQNLVFFSKQFEVLASIGLPVDRILEIIAEQATPKHFKKTLLSVRDSVVKGNKLSDAFADHPKYFNEIFIAIVASTESGIGLATAMAEISTILNQEQELSEKLSVSILYFKIVSLICVAAVVLMSIYIFPVYENFLHQFSRPDIEFSLNTKFYIAFGKILINYPFELSVLSVSLFFLWKLFKKTETGKFFLGFVSIRGPVMGKVRLEYANAAIARLLSFGLKTGMTTQTALHLVIQATANQYVSWKLSKTYEELLEDGTFTTGLANNNTLIPPLKAALAVGEASGTLVMTLEVTAAAIEKHAIYRSEKAGIVIQNAAIVMMGIFILSFVLSVYGAVYTVYRAA